MLAARMPCRVSPTPAAPINPQRVVGPTRQQRTSTFVVRTRGINSNRRKARGTNANVDSCKG